MADKKVDDGSNQKPKKTNLLDHHSIKHILDESVTEIVTGKGYIEDFRTNDFKLFIGTIFVAIAIVAQFYNKKFPENRNFLIGCIVLYVLFNGILLLVSYVKEKDAFLFTYPPTGSFNSTGLIISSKLPRFSDKYTLTIGNAVTESISSKPPVELTKSITQWFASDGVFG